ncbi:MAG: DUF4012 domain-containing protein [Candidatus Magasanikbacteria bacterium]|nr:DUF4012 domain-containing protein [Candidatus Magasanikbacteria bacterium]
MSSEIKTVRRCSLCRQAGHTKRNCSARAMPTGRQAKTTSGKFVWIDVRQTHQTSPHVIDLKNKRPDSVWNSVKVFSEKRVEPVKREMVDLAAMVRGFNHRLRNTDNADTQITDDNRLILRPRPANMRLDTNFDKPALSGVVLNIKYQISNIVVTIKERIGGIKDGIINSISLAKERALNIFSFKKFAFSAVVLLVLAILPFPAVGYYESVKDTSARVVEASANAFLSLQSSTVAAMHADLNQAEYDLNAALTSFNTANSILDKEHRALQYVAGMLPVIGRQVKSRQHLLVAGHHLALGNTYLVKGVEELNKQSQSPLGDKIAILANHLRSAVPQYQEALVELGGVPSETLPTEYQESFADFKLLFATFVDDMGDLVGLSNALQTTFGHDQLRRYLLVFQNNDELRPTGGFMGSFALLDAQKGQIVNLDIPGGGAYDLQGQLDVFVKPPLPLQLANKRWEFQDANWFPDFPAAARKIEWFYQHGRGATVDGVIAINATVLERLLSVIGPVQSADKNLVIVSSDAVEKLQQQIEFDYDKNVNKPKEILSELAPQILAGFGKLDTVGVMRLVSELEDALQKKEIQLYFNDESTQAKLAEFGWTGGISPVAAGQDYLSVVNTNIHGQKSDAKIKQSIEHQAVIQADGSIIDTVFVHRAHSGVAGVPLYGVNSVDYLRIYAPEGSELLDAGGFTFPPEDVFKVPEDWYKEDVDLANQEKQIGIHAQSGTRITNEFGKTAFGNWVMVAPGNTETAYFVYRLPFKADSRYSLLAQKQSGIDSDFATQVIYPDGWSPVWSTGEEMRLASNGASYGGVLDEDRVVGVVMQQY